MPATTYRRRDQDLTVELSTGAPRRRPRVLVTGPGLAVELGWSRAGRLLVEQLSAVPPLPPAPIWYPYGEEVSFDRLVLRVPEAVAGAPWEAALADYAAGRIIVRVGSGVPTAQRSVPLALPLRIAAAWFEDAATPTASSGAARRARDLGTFLADLTRYARSQHAVSALEFASCPAGELDAVIQARGWPTIDVLQLDAARTSALLSREPERRRAGLDWLERLVARYQVRLLVLPFRERSNRVTSAQRLGAKLVDRGGPAVVIAPGRPRQGWDELAQLYAGLVHDQPLDVALALVPGVTLHAGGGREESLRISAGPLQVLNLSPERLRHSLERILETDALVDRAAGSVRFLATRWPNVDFGGEGTGMFPTAEALSGVVELLRPHVDRGRETAPSRGGGRPQDQMRDERRYVNAHLLGPKDHGEPEAPVPQVGPALVLGTTYLLALDVGPLAAEVEPAGAVQLLVEDQLWDPVDDGLWTQVGVSGLGCTVLGSPIQPLWVPRRGASPPRHFAVRMDRPGVAVLRYTLYHRDAIVQSFRLAAVVAAAPGEPHRPGEAIAQVLGLSRRSVGRRSWYARLEFSTVATVAQAAERGPRTLSIVVNDTAGAPTITVKGGDSFEASTPGDLDTDVRAVRDALNEVSGHTRGGYAFGLPGDPNAASDTYFAHAMGLLAAAGARLWSQVIPAQRADDFVQLLAEPGATLQIAHILRDKVVPWALVYDRPYDSDCHARRGRPVDHVACTASLPAPDGTLPVRACGTHPDCPLHPGQLAQRDSAGAPTVLPKTVACPLGFWGVRHRIELPPQQVPPGGTAQGTIEWIEAGANARLLLGFNASIRSTEQHRQALADAMSHTRRGGAPAMVVTDRDDVVDALEDADLDVIYVFCHARGGEADGDDPRLEFQDPTDPAPRPIRVEQLPVVRWNHRPLVILNGCGTTGFSARATSRFIAAMVDRRAAAAVIGAEVPIAEELAREVGTVVLRALLDDGNVGAALENARRGLLARRNPLGLAYTLFGSLDLALRPGT